MSLETFLAISAGAVLGANARYLVGGVIAERATTTFPVSTLVVNVTGSFLLGIVLGLVVDRGFGPTWWRPFLAIGFLGSYTTFSTFSWETVALIESGAWTWAALNIAGSVVLSIGATVAGIVLVRVI